MAIDVERAQAALQPQEDLAPYAGQWVVLRHGHVVAHGPDPAQLAGSADFHAGDILVSVGADGDSLFL